MSFTLDKEDAPSPIPAGIIMSLSATGAFGLALTLAPPRSGPNCLTEDCVTYPFTAVAEYAPTDYWWMYPATVLPLAFVITLVLIRRSVPPSRQNVAWVAILAASAASVVLTLAYAVQLMTVQPSLKNGELDHLALWSQYNPHGLFIAFENVGYLFASLALLASAWLFPDPGALPRAIRWWCGTLGTIGVLGLPALALLLRYDLEYHYEVLSLVATWLGLLVLGPLLVVRQRSRRVDLQAPQEEILVGR